MALDLSLARDIEWRVIAKCSTYEISESGDIRKAGVPSTARTPYLNQKGYAYFQVRVKGKRVFVSQRSAYEAAFGRHLPGHAQVNYINPNEYNFECPYKRGIIETGYGNGKPDARYSPLDWYHQELPEAVIFSKR